MDNPVDNPVDNLLITCGKPCIKKYFYFFPYIEYILYLNNNNKEKNILKKEKSDFSV